MTDWAAEAVTRGDMLLGLLPVVVLVGLRILLAFIGAQHTRR
jgi:hypothetical protein